jgi:putative phosphoribosyl transferase
MIAICKHKTNTKSARGKTMLENDPTSTSDVQTPSKLLHVEAGVVVRDAILMFPANAQGIILLATHTPQIHQQMLALGDAFYQQGLASLLVDLFSTEELQLDAESGYFRVNVDIMQQRMIGVAEWLLQHPETEHCSIGYFGVGIMGAAALFAAAERPDVVATIVAEGAQLDTFDVTQLSQVTAPTLLFASGQDEGKVQAGQRVFQRLNVEKHFASLSGSAPLFENNKPLPELVQLAVDWFQRHLTWIASPNDSNGL